MGRNATVKTSSGIIEVVFNYFVVPLAEKETVVKIPTDGVILNRDNGEPSTYIITRTFLSEYVSAVLVINTITNVISSTQTNSEKNKNIVDQNFFGAIHGTEVCEFCAAMVRAFSTGNTIFGPIYDDIKDEFNKAASDVGLDVERIIEKASPTTTPEEMKKLLHDIGIEVDLPILGVLPTGLVPIPTEKISI